MPYRKELAILRTLHLAMMNAWNTVTSLLLNKDATNNVHNCLEKSKFQVTSYIESCQRRDTMCAISVKPTNTPYLRLTQTDKKIHSFLMYFSIANEFDVDYSYCYAVVFNIAKF